MMKRRILLALLAPCALSCTSEMMEPEVPASVYSIKATICNITKVSVDAAGKTSWDDGDQIGVFYGGKIIKFTLSEGAGTADGVFACEEDIRAKSPDGAAVYPYDESATLTGTQMEVILAASGAHGKTMPAPMAGRANADGSFVFRNIASILRIKYSNLPSMAEYVKVTADKSIAGAFTLTDYTNASLTLADASENNVVKAWLPELRPDNAAYVDIPVPSGTLASIKVELYGMDDKIIDTHTTTSAKTFAAGVIKPLETVNIPGDRLKLEWIWDSGSLPTFRANVPAIDDNGNVYVTSNEGAVHKLDNKGRELWRASLDMGGKVETSPSVEKDGSAVYMAGGQDGAGTIYALNADGTVKWKYEQWPWDGTEQKRNFWQSFIGIGKDNLYIPVGTLSTILSVRKTDGSRIAYGTGKADGTNGGLNGPGSGCAIGLGGTVSYMTTYGGYSWNKSLLDNPASEHVTYGRYALWGYQDLWPGWGNFKNDKNGILATKKGPSSGANVIISCAQESKGRFDVVCYPASLATDNTLTRHDNDQIKYYWRHQIGSNTDDASAPAFQDQGGIVMGHENLVCIVPMKYRSGAGDAKIGEGGLYSVWVGRNASVGDGGSSCWRVTTGSQGVSGAAAVDNNGNVHFTTDSYYYIIKPNTNSGGSYQVLAKESIRNLLLSSGLVSDVSKTGVWSSVKIGKDGKIYLNVNLDNSRGVTCCFTYPGVTGPDQTSSWPQKGADQYNSCNQQI